MKEIRIHGRAGQGAITTARILAMAAFADDIYALAFPRFGAERMGAPMNAFVRLDNKKIKLRSQIYTPDYVIVIDPTLTRIKDFDVFEGLKSEGAAIVNYPEGKELEVDIEAKVWTLPATQIALDVIGQDRANTPLLGAFAAATGEISISALERGIRQNFGEGSIADKNLEAVKRAYDYIMNQKAQADRKGWENRQNEGNKRILC